MMHDQAPIRWPAPAKLNLFLHVNGRRPDGYHELQTLFIFLNHGDWLEFEPIPGSDQLTLSPAIPGVPDEQNLIIRAARLLQTRLPSPQGAHIRLEKVLPMGGGIGGGSSDAATTLVALNHLWQAGLGEDELAQLGVQLGADVPVFVFGRDAFAEGVGEALQPLELPPAWYVVISPGVQVPTAEIFSAGDLTRNTPPIIMPDFAASTTRNDLQPVACSRYPEVLRVIEWLDVHAPARMTGSGACVFAEVSSEEEADRITKGCPPRWKAWKARSIARHPLYEWLQ